MMCTSNNSVPWDPAGWSCVYVTDYKLCYKALERRTGNWPGGRRARDCKYFGVSQLSGVDEAQHCPPPLQALQ